ncbi:MAG: HAMP domain-containing sensor histidine kinase [Lachnospiraceae bacterium]|nr:HAMP domain-containing sensor histidine kinase [Lachnospiraceae bacterium]
MRKSKNARKPSDIHDAPVQQEQRVFRRSQLIWYYALSFGIVVGSVMSFGLIASFAFDLGRESALSMIFMIIPMSFVMYGSVRYLTSHMENRLGPLLTGIHRVAEGDLTVQLNENHAAEYTMVYEEFNHMVKELQTTKDEMQSFVNEFTHEFKTPITSISGFADLLCEMGDELPKEEREEYLQIIADQAKRLSNLSQNSLLLSKVEAVQILTGKEVYSLTGQLQECAVLLIHEAEKRHIQLDFEDENEITYYGNKELMEQVWINLLGNSLKFTPEHGSVVITQEDHGSEIRIGIHDTGEGMSDETISHIFEKYYQHDLTNVVKGNGIGLAIADRIVKLSGGRIEVESELGKGSTFTVVLYVNRDAENH